MQYYVYDTEVYSNYYLVCFKNINTKKVFSYQVTDPKGSLSKDDISDIRMIVRHNVICGFNSRNYDLPLLNLACSGAIVSRIKEVSDYIVKNNTFGWQLHQKFNIPEFPFFVHDVDLQNVSPAVKISLKLSGARLNSKRLQELPITPETQLTKSQMREIKKYCKNDLDVTELVLKNIRDRVDLRFSMAEEYGKTIISKSDAQIAEIVIKKKLSKFGVGFKRPDAYETGKKGPVCKYEAPKYIKFKTDVMKEAFELIKSEEFTLDAKGSIQLPKSIKSLKIQLGSSKYQLGVGGIHSSEKSQAVIPNKNQVLADRDVASYYPNIILNNKMYPKHLGEKFLRVYRDIVVERLIAKANKNKVVNESLKIVINGAFGKLGNKYSSIYSPELLMRVTLTGQLSLLMLIEDLELNGISVVSANTDGFVSLMNKSQYDLYDGLCWEWELRTNLQLEETLYSALYSRDVNNYLAITKDGKSKGKGIFTLDSISKNPQNPVCIDAVINYLTKDIPIEKTIMSCTDVTRFLNVRTVAGGAEWKKEYLGRVVRWIYSTEGSTINYVKNGNKVPKSDNSRPIMELSDFPKDIDYTRYIKESEGILQDIGLL